MAEGRKSTSERTYLDMGNEKAGKTKQEKLSEEYPNGHKESKKSVSCPSSDGMKSKQPPNTKNSPTSGVNTDIRMKSLNKNDGKVEKTMQQKTSKEDRDRYEEFEEPVARTSSDEFKDKWPIHSVSSPTSLEVTSNIELTYLDRINRKLEKTKQENSSGKEPNRHEESERPMPCRSSDEFYDEQLPTSESNPTSGVNLNIEMKYLHNTDKKVEKYLEIIDDVTIRKEKGLLECGDEKPIPCTSLDKFNTKRLLAKESMSASGATKNISIEMTYLHKKDEEKVDKYRYMSLDEDRKRREDLGRCDAPCASSTGVNVRPAAQECRFALDSTSSEYDDVVIESTNSSDTSPGGYEERPPVPGRSHSRWETSTQGETSVYQELK